MKRKLVTLGGAITNCFKRFVGRVFPCWKEKWRAPLTIHYKEPKPLPRMKKATLITQVSLSGKTRYIVDEGGGRLYEMPKNQFSEGPMIQ